MRLFLSLLTASLLLAGTGCGKLTMGICDCQGYYGHLYVDGHVPHDSHLAGSAPVGEHSVRIEPQPTMPRGQ